MEHIDYDLAVRLREAGYPQIKLMGEFCWGIEGEAYAPVLTEIKIEIWKLGDDRFPIISETDEEITQVISFMQHLGRGHTFEEAAVNLYIMLRN